MNNMLSFLLPNGEFMSFGEIKNDDHNSIYESYAKYVLENKNISIKFHTDEMFFMKAIGLSAFENVVSICNSTDYRTSDVCNSIIIYSPTDLTDKQKDIMLQFFDKYLKDIKNVTIALIDSNCQFSECKLDDYISSIKSVSKKIV